MADNKHTETPWEMAYAHVNDEIPKSVVIWSKKRPKNKDDQYQLICTIARLENFNDEDSANAEHIVHCVNHFQEVFEALKAMWDAYPARAVNSTTEKRHHATELK